MTTINDIAPGDNGADSLVDIEANFANLNTDKIERDGSIPMTGDLDMGTNDITNIGAVRLKGDIQFDVKGYGAIGDGTTDDVTAIQAALDAANTAGGGTVFLPEGSYKITDNLTIYDNTTFKGQGMATVIESQNANADNIILFNTNADNIILDSFYFLHYIRHKV